ncbi:aspartyl-phosphate phosphatase Spo0E family protein [Bacillus thuringiensis]|nr:aspartyl-phosphate phosphatase Spo0E family protein [Bacillus thuringiensis]
MELNKRELEIIIEDKKQELIMLTQKFSLNHEKVIMCSQDIDYFVYCLMKKYYNLKISK